ncbi:helix-turn-helix domain-containing protein [Spiroplasma poulsonii]|uniref:helix-turn-helix domain-containing protein n=1 Tax=Spiroplasma poulsonii TaxID=2138 RepID=UPI001F4CD602|nr:transposase family protein [Spiroplasma poulsonii]UNF62291.1 transposase family protein [Spiroplasma poulsonii]
MVKINRNKNQFNKMLDILKVAEIEKFKKVKHKLILENRFLLMTLHWREYRSYFLILVKSFDISEANCYRNIKWIEDILIKTLIFNNCW